MYTPSPYRTMARPGLRGLGVTLQDLAAAITRQEGACSAPGVCVDNNPGNLRAYAPGQPVDARGIRIFPSFQAGYDALLSQERYNVGRGLTLDEFFGGKAGVYPGYAPAADRNNPAGYSANVSNWLGIPRDVTLSSILGGSDVSGSTATPGGVFDVGAEDWLGTEAATPPFSPLSAADDGGLSPLAWGAVGLAALGLAWAVS